MITADQIFEISDGSMLSLHKDTCIKLAIKLYTEDNAKKGVKILEHYLNVVGLDREVLMHLADAYRSISNFSAAEKIYSEVNDKWPDYASAYCGRAWTILAQKNRAEDLTTFLNNSVENINNFYNQELRNFCFT